MALNKTSVDILVVGKYSVEGGQVQVTLYKIDKNYDDRRIAMKVPMRMALEPLAAQVITPYQRVEKKEPVTCWFAVKPKMFTPVKEEKLQLLKEEAGGNPFVAANLKRVDFNILSPVEVVVQVDGQLALHDWVGH